MDAALEKVAISLRLHGVLRRLGRRGSPTKHRLHAILKKTDLKVPKAFAAGVSEPDKVKAFKGYRAKAMRNGTDSFALFIPQLIAEKALGKKKVRKAFWKYLDEPALRADTAAGNLLAKTPVIGRAFKVKEQVPWGKGLHKDIERSSALGPLSKLRDISEPIAVGVGLERGIHKIKEIAKGHREGAMHDPDKDLRVKVASTMLRLNRETKEHTKRAHALRLIYKQAESGQGVLPQTYSELETKLASLLTQDLDVLEKAMELNLGSVKLGELAQPDGRALNPTEQFQATILGQFEP